MFKRKSDVSSFDPILELKISLTSFGNMISDICKFGLTSTTFLAASIILALSFLCQIEILTSS